VNEVLEKIRQVYPALTKGQKKLAGFVLSNHEKAAFLSTSELAALVGVSGATVFRFAVSLGYKGFPEFKKDMQIHLRRRITQSLKLKKTTLHKGKKDGLLERAFRMDVDNLNRTLSELVPGDFCRAVDFILHAKQVYTIGLRGSAPLSAYFGAKLKQIAKRVTVLTLGADDIYEDFMHFGNDCTVIGFSFTNYSRMTICTLKQAKASGARVVGFTDHIVSPVYQLADVAFTPRIEGVSFSNSYTAVFTLMNTLLAEIAEGKKNESLAFLKATEELLKKYDQYLLG
jgi:DNA-binding MurR/RpiR family transcriptional regulator